MRVFTALTLGVAVAGTLAAAQSKAPAAQAGGGDAAIRAVADQYVKATMANDAKAIAALYADDAVEMPPNHASVKGRAAIEKYYQEQMAAAKIGNFALQHLETRAMGDNGYDIGTYRQTVTPAKGQPMKDTGKYTVIVKHVGGAWKVAYAIYNSDNPPPAGH
jgi:uncharacterized protein (TIGR02246 family)